VLTGTTPFQGRTALDTFRQMLTEEPARLRSRRPDVPRELEAVRERCLHNDPRKRYPTAADLAADLRRFLAGASVQARLAGPVARALRWARRHPAMATFLLALLFVGVALLLGLFWHTVGLQHALDETERERARASRNEAAARNLQYSSDMNLADHMLTSGEVFRLPALLDRHRPEAPGAADRRGFEWWYLDRYRHTPPVELQAHRTEVVLLAYSSDGQSLVTASRGTECVLKIWSITSTKPPFTAYYGATDYVGAVTFSPRGGVLAAVTESHSVTVWDASTEQERARLSHEHDILTTALSSDGRLLATGGNGPITVWDWAARKILQTFPDSSRRVKDLEFAPDGRSLASLDETNPGDVRIWDLATNRLRRVLHPPLNMRSPAYSPGGTLLVAPGNGNGPVIWAQDGTLHHRWLPPPTSPVSAVAISPDERILATGTVDGSVQFWDLDGRRQLGVFRWQVESITRLAFSPDGKTLAVGTHNGMVYQLDAQVPDIPGTLRPAFSAAGGVVLSPDLRTLAVIDEDRRVRLLDPQTGQVRLTLSTAPNSVRLVFAPDSLTLATVGNESEVLRLWDTKTGQQKPALSTREQSPVRCVAFSPPAGSPLAAGLADGRMLFLERTTGAELTAWKAHSSETTAAAFSPDGRVLATGGRDGSLALWDVQGTGPPRARAGDSLRASASIGCLTFSPDGRMLATGDDKGRVQLWQLSGNGSPTPAQPPLVESSGAPVTHLQFSSDGQTLLSVNDRRSVRLWDLRNRTAWSDLNVDDWKNADGRSTAALSPNGRTLFSVLGDGGLQIVDLPSYTIRTPVNQPPGLVRSLAFTPDGGTLITGSDAPDVFLSRRGVVGLGPFVRREVRWEASPLRSPASTVRLWDPAGGAEKDPLPGRSTMAPPSLVALAPGGPILAGGCRDGSVWLWDMARRQLLARLFITPEAEDYSTSVERVREAFTGRPQYPQAVGSVALSPDGRLLAAAGDRGDVTLWGADGWRVRQTWPGTIPGQAQVAFSPDAATLLMTRGGQVQLRDPHLGGLRSTLGEPGDHPVECVAFNPRGDTLAVGYSDRSIRLWDLGTSRQSAPLIGHRDRVTSLAFSPDGKTLASGSWDRTAKLWSVAALQEVATLEAHRGYVHCVAFSPDGRVLASGGETATGPGEVYLWPGPPR
jgi:WD40 repeat protein